MSTLRQLLIRRGDSLGQVLAIARALCTTQVELPSSILQPSGNLPLQRECWVLTLRGQTDGVYQKQGGKIKHRTLG